MMSQQIPRDLYPNAKLVYLYVVTRISYPIYISDISLYTGIARNHVRDIIEDLVELDYVDVIKFGGVTPTEIYKKGVLQ